MLKRFGRRYFALLLSVIMALSLSPVLELPAFADINFSAEDLGVPGLTASSSDEDKWSFNNGELIGTATGSTDGCNGVSSSSSLNFSSTLASDGVLSFDWTLENGGSFTVGEDASDDSDGSYTGNLAAGGTLSVKVTSKDTENETATITISNITLIEGSDVTTTFKAAVGGSYTVASSAMETRTVTNEDVENVQFSATPYTLTASPSRGYKFVGWYDGNDTLLSDQRVYNECYFNEDAVVNVRFTALAEASVSISFPGVGLSSLNYVVTPAQASALSSVSLTESGVITGLYTEDKIVFTAVESSACMVDGWSFDSNAVADAKVTSYTVSSLTAGQHTLAIDAHALTSGRSLTIHLPENGVDDVSYTVTPYGGSAGAATALPADGIISGLMEQDTVDLFVSLADQFLFTGWFKDSALTSNYSNTLNMSVLMDATQQPGGSGGGEYWLSVFDANFAPIAGYTPEGNLSVLTRPSYDESSNKRVRPWTVDAEGNLITTNQGIGSSVSSMKAVANEAGTLAFEYKVSSEGNWDALNYGDVEKNPSNYNRKADKCSGEQDWRTVVQQVEAGEAIYFCYVKDGSGDSYSDSVWVRNLGLYTGDPTITVSASDASYGTVSATVAGEANDLSAPVPLLSTVKLTAAGQDGGQFLSWIKIVNGNRTVVSKNAEYSFTALGSASYEAVFVPPLNGTPVASIGSAQFPDLNTAFSYAVAGDTVVLLTDFEQTTDITVPQNVALLIPCESTNALYTTAAWNVDTYTAPTEYRCLTVSNGATVTVDGAICVMSRIYAAAGNENTSGGPSGPYGRIHLVTGSDIVLRNGSVLYAYGFITGNGQVTAQSGSAVHETFQIGEFGGGARFNAIAGNEFDVFPFCSYFVQNIEANFEIQYGATETLHAALYASSSINPVDNIPFIGTSTGLFRVEEGTTLSRKYLPLEDRMEYILDGDANLDAIELSVIVTVSSSDYVLPISSNMHIHVKSGTTHINYPTKMIPGSKLEVDAGAVIDVRDDLFVIDATEWLKSSNKAKSVNTPEENVLITEEGPGYGFVHSNLDIVNAGYSPTRAFIRTADNLEDAEIVVNGTLDASSALANLVTTTSGANITSTSDTGRVILANNSARNLYQTINGGGSGWNGWVHFVQIGTTAAQLKNGDGYAGTGKEYIKTADAGVGEYRYDATTQQWYKLKAEYNFNGNIIYNDYFVGDTSTYEATAIENLGVSSATNGTPSVTDNTITVTGITEDTVVYVTGTPMEYTPSFVLNERQYQLYQVFNDGNTLSTLTIGEDTYYVLQEGSGLMTFGAPLAAPADSVTGVNTQNGNSIDWKLSDSEYGLPFLNTVPQGSDGVVYIYGFYSGGKLAAVYDGSTTEYYTTLEAAFDALEAGGTYTVTLYADCGTFEDESKTVMLATPEDSTVTFDLNGHTAWGYVANQSVMTLDLNGGLLLYSNPDTHLYATQTVLNLGTMTIRNSGASGTDQGVIRNDSTRRLMNGTSLDNTTYQYEYFQAAVRNTGGSARLTIETGVTLEETDATIPKNKDGNPTNAADYFAAVGLVNLNGAAVVDTKANITVPQGAVIYNFSGVITEISGGTLSGRHGIYNRNITTNKNNSTPCVATIGTIGSEATVSTTVFAVHNRSIINTISAQMTSGTNTIYVRGDQWYYATNSGANPGRIDLINSAQIKATSEQAIRVENGGYIGELSGSGTITAPKNTIYVYNQHARTSTTSGLKTTTTFDPSTINEIKGVLNVTATGGSYAIINYGKINKITGNVTLKASNGTTVGVLYDSTLFSQRIDQYTSDSYPRDLNRTYTGSAASIGEISDGVTIWAGNTGGSNIAILNRGYIAILRNITLKGASNVLCNGNNSTDTYWNQRTSIVKYGSSSSLTSGEKTKTFTYGMPTIDTIDSVTITFTSKGILNYGDIGSIVNSTISTTGGERAVDNQAYMRTGIAYTYASGTGSNNAPTLTEDASARVTTYSGGRIVSIGAGNTIQATTNVILNSGTITEIDGGGTTTITATASGGVGVYNYRGQKIPDASGNDYQDPVIGTIENVTITAPGYGIKNGEGNADYGIATINEIGTGTIVTSSSSDVVRNMASAKITEISGGVYTASASGNYAYYNDNTADGYATLLSGGDYKGGTDDRGHAVYDYDNLSRITYPEGKGLIGPESVGLVGGYYYVDTAFAVTFDLQDHGEQISTIKNIQGGERIAEPIPPTAEGYQFGGWYKEAACTNAWNFATDTVTANTTLYAKWTCTVTFNMQGHGTQIEPITNVTSGSRISEPTAPTAEGYTFNGWYKEAGFVNAWNFATDTVTEETILYAKWTINTATIKMYYHLSYGGQAGDFATFTYSYGDTLNDPEYVYCTFDNWTYNNTTYSSNGENDLPSMKAALDNELKTSTGETIEVTANFTRQTYSITVYTWVSGETAPRETVVAQANNRRLGYATKLTASETMEDDGNTYNFSYWLIGTGEDYDEYERYDSRTAAFFPTVAGAYNAIMVFGASSSEEESDGVSFRILNETREKYGDIWRAVITLELNGPAGGYELYYEDDTPADGEKPAQVGFKGLGVNYIYSPNAPDDVSKVSGRVFFTDMIRAINGMDSAPAKSGGTYTLRIQVPNDEWRFYAYAFVKYRVGDGPWVTKYATKDGVETTDNATKYDTITFSD